MKKSLVIKAYKNRNPEDGPPNRSYPGIQRMGYLNKDRVFDPGIVMVLVWFEGEPELWLVDVTKKTARELLQEYYYCEYGIEESVQLDVFAAPLPREIPRSTEI